jgi:hypothetical protein
MYVALARSEGSMYNLMGALNANRNFLLCSLPPIERELLLLHLEAVTLPLGKIDYEPDERIDYCYLPTNSVGFVALHHARRLNRGDGSGRK